MGKNIRLVIALTPPEHISNKVRELREKAIRKTNCDEYGNHDPHITLFCNTFESFTIVEKELTRLCKKIKPFTIKINEIKYFDGDEKDPELNIMYVAPDHNDELVSLMRNITSKLNKIRTDDQQKQFYAKVKHPDKVMKHNLDKYGYYYGPDNWSFHMSIAQIPKEYRKLFESKKYKIKGQWTVKNISILVGLGTDGYRVYRKISLAR